MHAWVIFHSLVIPPWKWDFLVSFRTKRKNIPTYIIKISMGISRFKLMLICKVERVYITVSKVSKFKWRGILPNTMDFEWNSADTNSKFSLTYAIYEYNWDLMEISISGFIALLQESNKSFRELEFSTFIWK